MDESDKDWWDEGMRRERKRKMNNKGNRKEKKKAKNLSEQ